MVSKYFLQLTIPAVLVITMALSACAPGSSAPRELTKAELDAYLKERAEDQAKEKARADALKSFKARTGITDAKLIAKAEAAMREQLKDPDSAKFSDAKVFYNTRVGISVCGYVNARNSYGGYTGKQLWTSNTAMTGIIDTETNPPAADKMIAMECRDKE